MIAYWFLMNFAAVWCLVPEGLRDAADRGNQTTELPFFFQSWNQKLNLCASFKRYKTTHRTLSCAPLRLITVPAATRIGIKKILILQHIFPICIRPLAQQSKGSLNELSQTISFQAVNNVFFSLLFIGGVFLSFWKMWLSSLNTNQIQPVINGI